MPSTPNTAPSASVDMTEVERFSRMAATWWDTEGPFKPLHRLNPIRLTYIRDSLCRQFDRDPGSPRPLEGLRVVDIGCGGGLLCEPVRRLGAEVVGIDPSEKNVGIARQHATDMGLEIDYVCATAEDLAEWGEKFDAILNMEVVEHVQDVPAFLASCGQLMRDDRSCMTVATLNRTLKSYALAIVGAEYVLRWLPRGTHDWNRFVRPSELRRALEQAGLHIADLHGVAFAPLAGTWRLTKDLDVNYVAFATRTAA